MVEPLDPSDIVTFDALTRARAVWRDDGIA